MVKRLVEGTVNALPFAEAAFDLVTSFDVLTAAGVDDAAAPRGSVRVLRPGRHLLAQVAADAWLRRELCAKVSAAGSRICLASEGRWVASGGLPCGLSLLRRVAA